MRLSLNSNQSRARSKRCSIQQHHNALHCVNHNTAYFVRGSDSECPFSPEVSMEVLFFIFLAFLGIGAFIIPWVALGIGQRNTSKLSELEGEHLRKFTVLENKLLQLERRLKLAEALRDMKEPAPAPAAVPVAVPVKSNIELARRLLRKFAPATENLAKSRAVRKFRRMRQYDQFLLSTLTGVKAEPAPVIEPPQKPATIESFVEQKIAERTPTAAPIPAPTAAKAPPQTVAAYAFDEDHDLKPSSFAGEQAHLDYLELLLGRKVLGWVAAIAMILSAVFLVNYTAQHFTLRPQYRVIGLFGLGLGLITFGYRYYLFGWKRFSRMLTSTGIVISFLAGYAAYGYYQLIPSTPAFLLMSVVVIGSFLLAYGYRSILIGVHAIIGGLAVPLLVKGVPEMYPQLFAYLFLVNLGTVLLLNTLNRLPIGLLAMLGTQLEFFAWYLRVGTIEWSGREFLFSLDDPVCVRYAFAFQAAFYLLYLVDTSFGTISTRFRTTWDDTVRAILAPMIGFGWIYILFHQDPVFGGYMGLFAFIGAAWYALVHQLYAGFRGPAVGCGTTN